MTTRNLIIDTGEESLSYENGKLLHRRIEKYHTLAEPDLSLTSNCFITKKPPLLEELAVYSPQGCKESDTTKDALTHIHTTCNWAVLQVLSLKAANK